jgi:hypothetical protein
MVALHVVGEGELRAGNWSVGGLAVEKKKRMTSAGLVA